MKGWKSRIAPLAAHAVGCHSIAERNVLHNPAPTARSVVAAVTYAQRYTGVPTFSSNSHFASVLLRCIAASHPLFKASSVLAENERVAHDHRTAAWLPIHGRSCGTRTMLPTLAILLRPGPSCNLLVIEIIVFHTSSACILLHQRSRPWWRLNQTLTPQPRHGRNRMLMSSTSSSPYLIAPHTRSFTKSEPVLRPASRASWTGQERSCIT